MINETSYLIKKAVHNYFKEPVLRPRILQNALKILRSNTGGSILVAGGRFELPTLG